MSLRIRMGMWAGLMGLGLTFGCAGEAIDEDIASNAAQVSWEEFRDRTVREPWPGGMYIVDGDVAIEGEKQLREFYDAHFPQPGALIVHRQGNVDAKWSAVEQHNLTYCVSNTFGARKAAVVAAMAQASNQGWELAAGVNFIHVPAQDASCNATNQNVVFDVRPVSGQSYMARAFYPGQGRSTRNLLINNDAFDTVWPLHTIVTHELGHTLGFRHEHTRPEAAGNCFEDSSWRILTPYDAHSVMNYPQCVGTSGPPTISALDKQGAALLYGPPGPPPPPPPPPDSELTVSGSVAKGQQKPLGGLAVVPGSTFEATMTGTGDADLYVRFGAPPSLSSFHCRSWSEGSQESCVVTVPPGATTAHVMVHGYAAATYTVTRKWAAP